MNHAALFTLIATFLFLPTSAHTISVESLNTIDSSTLLAPQVGYDRLSKYLIASAPKEPGKLRITRVLLDSVIGELIDEGIAFEAIQADLQRGDIFLRDALVRLLAGFGYSNEDASLMILSWANEGASEELQTTIKNAARRPASISILSDYSIQTKEKWTHSLSGLKAVFDQQSQVSLPLLVDTILRYRGITEDNVKSAIDGAMAGNIEWRWQLALGFVHVSKADGALARYLASAPVNGLSWNLSVWQRILNRIASDPFLIREYEERLTTEYPLYEEIKTLMSDGIEQHGKPFLKGYMSGKEIPDSRFNKIHEQLNRIPEIQKLGQIRTSETEDVYTRVLSRMCRNEDVWAKYLMWHLTRVGESMLATIRGALPSVLSVNEEASKELLLLMPSHDLKLKQMLDRRDAFALYNGSLDETILKINDGTVERSALLKFGGELGALLSENDSAWSLIMQSDQLDKDKNDFLRKLVIAALRGEPETVSIWIIALSARSKAIRDMTVREQFAKYLISKKRLADVPAYATWASSLAEVAEKRELVGNAEAANFRDWFIEFINTPNGWNAVRKRIDLESTAVPFALRDAMVRVLLEDQERFWRIFSMTTSRSGDSVAKLKPTIKAYAFDANLPGHVIKEIGDRNTAASDVIDSVWNNIMTKDSPVMTELFRNITDGSTLSDEYRLVIMAIMNALQIPEYWQQYKEIARSHMGMATEASDEEIRKALYEQMQRQGALALPFTRAVLENDAMREAVRVRILKSVRFLGEGHVIANFIATRPQLFNLWSDQLTNLVADEPLLMRNLMDALYGPSAANGGNPELEKSSKFEFFQVVVRDRVLFEQVLAGKNQDFWSAFSAELSKANQK